MAIGARCFTMGLQMVDGGGCLECDDVIGGAKNLVDPLQSPKATIVIGIASLILASCIIFLINLQHLTG